MIHPLRLAFPGDKRIVIKKANSDCSVLSFEDR